MLALYTAVFGIGHQVAGDSDALHYRQLTRPDGEGVAGIMDAAGSPADGDAGGWTLHIGSHDVDGDLAKVTAAGGTVCSSPRRTLRTAGWPG